MKMGDIIEIVGSYLIMPVMMVVIGYWFSKNPPKQINHFSGYRTAMSKKNMDTWRFAHLFFGRLWLKYGMVLLIATLLSLWPLVKVTDLPSGYMAHLLLAGVQGVFVFVPIFLTERELRRQLDENGKAKRKDPFRL
jgi:uncharacterized membrane protein